MLEALASVPKPTVPGVRWSRVVDHVTLRFWPAVEADEVLALVGACSLPPATAACGPGTRVLGRRVLVVPVEGLDRLAASLGTRPPFSGHITIARGRHLERLVTGSQPPRAVWEVESVVAFRSELLPAGARHTEIGRWAVGHG